MATIPNSEIQCNHMIIESALYLALVRLMEKPDCSRLREEDFSFAVASSCERVLQSLGVPYPTRIVEVETPYEAQSKEHCDIVLKTKELKYPHVELSHNSWVECKFFRRRKSVGNETNNAGALWNSFRRTVYYGGAFAYTALLCEADRKSILPSNGKHASAVKLCLDSSSSASFSLWDSATRPVSQNVEGKSPMHDKQTQPNDIEFKIVRSFTEPLPLKFEAGERLFRAYLFRLLVKGKCFGGFEFR